MRKYFTWRCIGLHVLVVIVVPIFFLLGRWQYHAARSGNTLSWAYTVEWPLFGLYAIYMWWQLIHDRSTPFDRFRAAKERSAAAASGVPIEEIPGWAMDKTLSRAMAQASLGLGTPELPGAKQTAALESEDRKLANDRVREDAEDVVDAHVVHVKVEEDEELLAYNRYLADLDRNGPPKRW